MALVTTSASALCHGVCVVSSGVGLGPSVPSSSSLFFSGVSFPSSFPTPPSSSYPFDFCSSWLLFFFFHLSYWFSSSPFPGLTSSVAYSDPSLPPAPPPGFPMAPPVRPVAPLGLLPPGPAFVSSRFYFFFFCILSFVAYYLLFFLSSASFCDCSSSFSSSSRSSFSVFCTCSPSFCSYCRLMVLVFRSFLLGSFFLFHGSPGSFFCASCFFSCSVYSSSSCFFSCSVYSSSSSSCFFSSSFVLSLPSSPLPSSSSLPSSLAPTLSSFDSLASASFPAPTSRAPVVPGAVVSSGAHHSTLGASAPGWSGAAGSLDLDGTYLYNDFDDSSMKEKGESALSKAAFSQAFHEVVSCVTGFFPHARN